MLFVLTFFSIIAYYLFTFFQFYLKTSLLSCTFTNHLSALFRVTESGDFMWEKITIKDVADKCGVSTATVSRALNNSGYVSDTLKASILQTCKEIGYIPNSTARSLKVNSTRIIGYITSDISNQYHITVAKAIEDIVRPSNYNLIVCSTRNDKQVEEQHLKSLLGRNIDALVINTTCENDDFIIFYGTDGLFCYDLSEKEIIFSVDFIKVSGTTGAVQGTAGTDVSVSQDGQSMILVYSDMDTPDAVYDAYYISIPTMTYHCGEYHPMEDAFNPENAVGYVLPGAIYSHTRYIRGDSSWDVFDGYKVE